MKIFNQKQLAMWLTALGALPLVVGGLLVLTDSHPQSLTVAPALALHLYAVIIASFVAGMHWGIHFCKRTSDSVYLLSSLCVVLLGLSLVWMGETLGLALVTACFILLWIEEFRLSRQRVTTVWFWQLRNLVSAVAVASLLLAIVGA